MIGIYLAPESPWWLIRRGRNNEALAVVRRLLSNPNEEDNEVEDTVAMMIHTNKIEQEMKAASTYWDCFKGIDLRRTEIAIITYLIQEFCAPIVSNATYFLEQAGLPATDSFDFSCGQLWFGNSRSFSCMVGSLLPRTTYITAQWNNFCSSNVICYRISRNSIT